MIAECYFYLKLLSVSGIVQRTAINKNETKVTFERNIQQSRLYLHKDIDQIVGENGIQPKINSSDYNNM